MRRRVFERVNPEGRFRSLWLDEGSGEPASNLLVTAVYEGEDADDVDRKTEFISGGGSVTLEGLTPGPWRVTLRKVSQLGAGATGGGIPDQRVEVTVGETATATFTVP